MQSFFIFFPFRNISNKISNRIFKKGDVFFESDISAINLKNYCNSLKSPLLIITNKHHALRSYLTFKSKECDVLIHYYHKTTNKLKNLSSKLIFQQSLTFLILKIMGLQILYKIIFFNIIKFAHEKKIKLLLKIFYPSLKFRIINFPNFYFSTISNFSLKLIYLQLIDKKKRITDFNFRKNNNIHYQRLLSKIKNKNFKTIKIKDFNYQNFIDFPIIIKNKEKLNKFLLKHGIETRFIYYRDCERIFNTKNYKCKNSNIFEKELLCLPNHKRVNYIYINKIVKYIEIFLNKK